MTSSARCIRGRKVSGLCCLIALVSTVVSFAGEPATARAVDCTITVTVSDSTVFGTSGPDVICVQGDRNEIFAGGGGDYVLDDGSSNYIYLEDGNDTYDGSDGQSGVVDGGSGDDVITGTPGTDDLDGGTGDDQVLGGVGGDSISGGDGADDLEGGPGPDSITGEAGNDTVDGGDGNDTLNGGPGTDSLIGGNADDVVVGGTDADYLAGQAGDDVLQGEMGPDDLTGGNGNDILVGGDGTDSLDGGSGLNKCDFSGIETRTTTCLYDDAAPTLTQLNFVATSWDSTSNPVDVEGTLVVSDDVGLRSGRILCTTPATDSRPEHAALDIRIERDRIGNVGLFSTILSSSRSDSAGTSTIRFSARLKKWTSPGVYSCSVELVDQVLNGQAVGISSAFVITRGPGQYDDQAPVLTVDSVEPTVIDSASAAKKFRVRFHVEDESGPKSGQFQCSMNVRGNWYELTNYAWWDQIVLVDYGGNGDTLGLTHTSSRTDFEVEFTIRQDTMPGTYTCGGHQTDSAGNHDIRWGVATIVIVNTAPDPDLAPPSVEDGSSTPTSVDVGDQDGQVTLSWRIKDDTGMGWGYLECRSGNNKILDSVFGSNDVSDYNGRETRATITGSLQDRSYSLPLKIPFGSYPGTYRCVVSVNDLLQHWASYEIASVQVDRTPPGMPRAPTGLSFAPTKDWPSEGVLSWSAPERRGDPILFDYQIQSSSDGTTWTTLPDAVSISTSVSLSNLPTAKNLWFRVRADNGGNTVPGSPGAPWSEVLAIRTPNPLSPLSPTGVQISLVTTSSATVSWGAPSYDGGSPLTDYKIELLRSGETTWNVVPHSASTARSIVISGLAPGTSYSVRVSAINSAGSSGYGDAILTTTATTPSAPQGLQGSDVTSSSARLSWSLPTSNGGSAITDYRIEVSLANGTTWTTIPHSASSALGFSVTGLSRATQYKFRVTAVNSLGPGLPSGILAIETAALPPSPPRDVSISSLSPGGGTVSWNPPSDNGGRQITAYLVATSRDAGETWNDLPPAGPGVRSMSMSGLAPGTSYWVRVTARNSIGDSEPVSTELVTGSEVPGSVPAPTTSEVTKTSVSLNWTLPISNGGLPITNYRIDVSSDGTSFQTLRKTDSNQRSFRVTGLAAGTAYWFRVAAINGLGTGASSSSVKVVTSGSVPSAPRSLAISSRNGSYTLSWLASSVSGGSKVRDYRVEVSSDNGVSWTIVPKSASTSMSLALSGLQRKTTYKFRVTAINDVGPSPTSAVLTFKTG